LDVGLSGEASDKSEDFEKAASGSADYSTDDTKTSTTSYSRSNMLVKGGNSAIFVSDGWDAWTATVFETGYAVNVNQRELQPIYDALPASLGNLETIRQHLNRAVAEYLDTALVDAQDFLGDAAQCIDVTIASDCPFSVSSQARVHPSSRFLASVAFMATAVVVSWRRGE